MLSNFATDVNAVESKVIRHRPLGHLSSKFFDIVLKSCKLLVKLNYSFNFCESCHGKSHSLAFPLYNSSALAPFELIHIDL